MGISDTELGKFVLNVINSFKKISCVTFTTNSVIHIQVFFIIFCWSIFEIR